MKKKIHVIPNSHWDFEWYFTYEQSNVMFNFHMKELFVAFENKNINYFILDGQTKIITSYLRLHPEDKKKVIKLNKENKLPIGPWYVQSDQMIISGENLVNNLFYGITEARDLGGEWKMGYVPDAFGQSKDLPKIFNGFGIEKMVFWRGLSDPKLRSREFNFVSEDDSSVVAYNIKEGYYAGGSIYWEEPEDIKNTLDTMASYSHINDLAYSLGGDQRYVDYDVRDQVKSISEKIPEYTFKLSTYENVFSKINKTKIPLYRGEMLDSQDSKIHRSIYSHRYDHKYLNHYLESTLTSVLEPLTVIGTELGIKPHRGLIKDSWERVIMNSAHDSAGGCNSDETNSYISQRFIEAKDSVDSYIDILKRKISETLYKPGSLTLFNTSMYNRNLVHRVKVTTKNKNFKIYKKQKEIYFDILNQNKIYYGSIKRDLKKNDPKLYYFETTIYIKSNLKPLSFDDLNILEQKTDNKLLKPLKSSVIEDKNFKLSFINNKLNIFEKKTNKKVNNFLNLTNQSDDGDAYDFSPMLNDKETNYKLSLDKVIQGVHVGKMFLKATQVLYKDIESKQNNKNTNKTKHILDIEITLDNSGNINVSIETVNNVKDHRVRLKLDPKITNTSSFADTPFGFIERPIFQNEMKTWKKLNWNEEPTGIYPLISTVISKDSKNQMNVFLSGIKEYEMSKTHTFITLYRSIGMLGKPGLQRRPGKASGQEYKYVSTPDSQLYNKNLKFKIGINFDNKKQGVVKNDQLKWDLNIEYYQNQELNRFTGPLKYFVSNKLFIEPKDVNILIEKNKLNESLVISSIKSFNDYYILRIYNPLQRSIPKERVGTIDFNNKYLFAETNLLNEEKSKRTNKLNLGLFKPGQIKTYKIIRKDK